MIHQCDGLFVCKKCGAEFTGGAYESETLIGKTIRKMVTQKSFAAANAELTVAEEKSSYSDIEEEVSRAMNDSDEKEEKKEKKVKKKKVKDKKKEDEE